MKARSATMHNTFVGWGTQFFGQILPEVAWKCLLSFPCTHIMKCMTSNSYLQRSTVLFWRALSLSRWAHITAPNASLEKFQGPLIEILSRKTIPQVAFGWWRVERKNSHISRPKKPLLCLYIETFGLFHLVTD